MSSRIEYYRPRGISGQYNITVIIERIPTESPLYGILLSSEDEWTWFDYKGQDTVVKFTPQIVVAGDMIAVNVIDYTIGRDFGQVTQYRVTEQNIEPMEVDIDVVGSIRRNVTLNPIELIDLDKKDD